MPYINHKSREQIDHLLEPMCSSELSLFTPGMLNYTITKILLATHPKRYADFNSLVGVLECVKLELVRRRLAVLENGKKEEHGDVY